MSRQTLGYGSFQNFHIYDDANFPPFSCTQFGAGQLAVSDANGDFAPSTILFSSNQIGVSGMLDTITFAAGHLVLGRRVVIPSGSPDGSYFGGVAELTLRGTADYTAGIVLIGVDNAINDEMGLWIDAARNAYIVADRGSTGYRGELRFHTAGTAKWRIGHVYTATDDFVVYNGTTPAIRIDQTSVAATFGGRVAIGTDNSSYWLNIEKNGSNSPIRARINNTGTSSGDHSLLSLTVASTGGNPFILWSRGSTTWIAGINKDNSNHWTVSATYDYSAPVVYFSTTTCVMSTDLVVTRGSFVLGVSGTTRGVFHTRRGTSTNAPGTIAYESRSGNSFYTWMADDGTLRGHNALPTADMDGSPVGAGSGLWLSPAQGIAYNGTTGEYSEPILDTVNGYKYVKLHDSGSDPGEALWFIPMPKNMASTVSYTIYWTVASGSGAVDLKIGVIALDDDDALSTRPTFTEADDTILAANDVHQSSGTGLAVQGTPSADDLILVVVRHLADGPELRCLGVLLTW